MRWDAPTEEMIEASANRCRARKLDAEKRKARLRLTCAALQALPYIDVRYSPGLAQEAVAIADACLALLYPEPAAGEVEK